MAGLLTCIDGRLRCDRIARPAGRLRAAGRATAPRVFVADTPLARAIGMLGTPDPDDDEALLLVPCSAVHGMGLRCEIGAIFADRRGVVLCVVDPLPWWGARVRGAHAVIEARAGVLSHLCPGDTIAADDDRIFPLGGNSTAA